MVALGCYFGSVLEEFTLTLSLSLKGEGMLRVERRSPGQTGHPSRRYAASQNIHS